MSEEKEFQEFEPPKDIETANEADFAARLRYYFGGRLPKPLAELTPEQLGWLQDHADREIDRLNKKIVKLEDELRGLKSAQEQFNQKMLVAHANEENERKNAKEITLLVSVYRKWVKTVPHKEWCAGSPLMRDMAAVGPDDTPICSCGKNYILSGNAGERFEKYVAKLEDAVRSSKKLLQADPKAKIKKADIENEFQNHLDEIKDIEVSLQEPLHSSEMGFPLPPGVLSSRRPDIQELRKHLNAPEMSHKARWLGVTEQTEVINALLKHQARAINKTEVDLREQKKKAEAIVAKAAKEKASKKS